MDVNNSNLLKLIIRKMDTYETMSGNSLTIECFWLAIFEFYTGNLECDKNEPDAAVVTQILNELKLDINSAKSYLTAVIKRESYNDYISSLEFQITLRNAQMFAKTAGRTQVLAAELLKTIIEEKLGETPKILSKNGNAVVDSDDFKVAVEQPAEKANPASAKQQLSDLSVKVKQIRDNLFDVVFGQDKAINTVATGYFQAVLNSLTDKKRTKPFATFLFAGPPGVGKTFLAEQLATHLDMPFMRFDMSEYGDINAIQDFCGSDSVYRKSKEGDVTGFAARNPKSIILFDEIEKAHLNIIHLFLQILDAGRIRDNFTGKEVLFKDIIIIFTTNAGRTLYEDTNVVDFSNVSQKVILKAIADDKKPGRDEPFFPPAICSRFATGNVVMFNHITAHNLISIAKREILRNTQGFERESGIKVELNEDVFAAILFAEGASADARTVKARAASFFNTEIYELLRLMSPENIASMENIQVDVVLPENKEIVGLFRDVIKPEVLIFTNKDTADICNKNISCCALNIAEDVEKAKDIIKKKDIKFVVIDLMQSLVDSKQKYLNIEDIDSPSRDMFKYLREYCMDMPIYLLEHLDTPYNTEEKISYFGQGARGIISIGEDAGNLNEKCFEICKQHTYHNSMIDLAKARKLIRYETAQTIEEDGKKCIIYLFDFKQIVAMDAEDTKSILSNISKPNIKFSDVIGAEDAKDELKYFVEFLKNPKKYMGTGVRAPRGVLLYGPPGTGKTLLAKALASEANVTYISAQGNQFLSKWIGEGPERMHDIFKTARKYAPAVLFIDEIDTIGAERDGSATRSEEGILTALLTEMDGFKMDATKPVFVLAATNYGVDESSKLRLDGALLRRFDRKIYVDLPTSEERVKYLKMKIEGDPLFVISEEEYENIAVRSTGMSLALLENVIELAKRMAIRNGEAKVTDEILDEALEISKYGEQKPWDKSLLERTARHEAGHAFVCWYGGEIPAYVTVVAREGHGGYMGHADKKGMKISTRRDLLARIRTSLAGRATELVYYGEEDGLTTGASSDLQNSTYFAERIICSYGMDDEFGLAVVDIENDTSMLPQIRPLVNKLLLRELENTKKIVSENKAAIDAMVEVLMTKNHLTGPQIDALFSQYAKMEQR